jgi:hypothetical protein
MYGIKETLECRWCIYCFEMCLMLILGGNDGLEMVRCWLFVYIVHSSDMVAWSFQAMGSMELDIKDGGSKEDQGIRKGRKPLRSGKNICKAIFYTYGCILCRSLWGFWWKLVLSHFNILAMSRTFMLQDSFQLNFNENVNSLNPLNSTCEASRWNFLRLPEGFCTHNPNYQSVILITSRNRKRKGDTGMSSNGMIGGLFWSKLMERSSLSSIQSKKFTVQNLRLPIPKCQLRSEWQNFSSWV